MKPTDHALQSVKRYGGTLDEYLEIHEWFDMTKAAHPDMRHRAILHNSMGPYIAVTVFGEHFTNSDGRMVDVRQVSEDHILEDLGRIPTVSDWLNMIPMTPDNARQFSHQRRSAKFRNAD